MVIVKCSNLLALFARITSRARAVFPRRATSRSISSLGKYSPPKPGSRHRSIPKRALIIGLLVGAFVCPPQVLPNYNPQIQALNSCRGGKDLERGKIVNGGKPCTGEGGPCVNLDI